jgi:hypothetical protein
MMLNTRDTSTTIFLKMRVAKRIQKKLPPTVFFAREIRGEIIAIYIFLPGFYSLA